MSIPVKAGIVACALLYAGAAHAQMKPFMCGDIQPDPSKTSPKIAPIFHSNAGLNNAGFDCMLWQDFIYLNWPALPGQRGVPNPKARFGAPGPTVWETYKTASQVFLPNGINPGPWQPPMLMSTLTSSLAQRVGSGQVRALTQTSKISRPALGNILRHAGVNATFLDEISQAGGGTLYDLNGYPVYYEIALNKMLYDYIVNNKLYNANDQIAYAAKNTIAFPPAASDDSESGLEIKAAWKVLSATEQKSGRFHTIQALIEGSKTPVTVGLVGMHMFIGNPGQGAWGTFAQVDNAPVATPATSGTFNFFNPKCVVPGTTTPCPVNVKDANPGQVVQITPDDPTAVSLNTYMVQLIRQYDPNSVWQYYKLVNVQWATNPVPLSSLPVPANAPLPDGKPNTPTLVNAVLETFVQQPGMGCFSCHVYATVASSGNNSPSYAAGYSFMFGRASAPK